MAQINNKQNSVSLTEKIRDYYNENGYQDLAKSLKSVESVGDIYGNGMEYGIFVFRKN